MGLDLQSEVLIDVNQGVNSLARLRSEYRALGAEIRATKGAAKDLQTTTTAGLPPGRLLQQGSQALGRVGGQAGSTFGQFAGAFGLSGPFAAVAIGAAAVGTALKVWSAATDVAVSKTKAMIDAENELSSIREAADKELKSSAGRGLADAKDWRRFSAATGPEGLRQLQDLTTGPDGGLVANEDEARRGIMALHAKVRPEHRDAALAVAKDFLPFGVPLDQIIDQIASGPTAFNGQGSMDATTARLGRNLLGLRGTNSEVLGTLADRQSDLQRDGYLAYTRQATRERARLPGIDRANAADRSWQDASDDVDRAIDPAGALTDESNRKFKRQVRELRAQAQAAGISDTILNVFGSNGSFFTQMERLIEARSKAEFRGKE